MPLRRLTVSRGMRWTSCGASCASRGPPPTCRLGRSTKSSGGLRPVPVAMQRSRFQLGCFRGLGADPRLVTSFRCRRCRQRRSARATCSSTLRDSRTSDRSFELSSRAADSVDLLCAFVIWSGVRHLREALDGGRRARRPGPRDHDDVHGCDGEAGGRRARVARRRGSRRLGRADDQAARQGMAPGAGSGLTTRSSARRTSRTRASSTGSSGTSGSRRSTPRTSSTGSG